MYSVLLILHSVIRWLVLTSLTYAAYRAYSGKKSGRLFSKLDDKARRLTVTMAHVQLMLGLWLYFISPIVDYFLHNFKQAVHMREIRFFGMEHITMMVISIVLLTMGSVRVKRKKTDHEKFKTMFTWYLIVLVIIFLSIPWAFSPFTSRPYLRW